MVTAVIGFRSFNDKKKLFDELSKIKVTKLVSGGANGADSLAENYGREKNISVEIFLPEYERYGRTAPLKRNDLIINSSEQVVAFWDGKSRGTKFTIDLAKKRGIPVHLFIVKD